MTGFSIDELLRAARDGALVDTADLRAFIAAVGAGDVPDYQIAAFLMAVYCRGLSRELVTELTLAMRDSGRVFDLAGVLTPKVDKHSTGGVGDKVSLALAPIVASRGLAVPMISGRGLGHSGGTLDKLEAIPGFRVGLSLDEIDQQMKRVGCVLVGQTDQIAPVDRKFYALRDVTATVESIALITASILSKKLAEGIDALVLDVKVGTGAFMKTPEEAHTLARSLVEVGAAAGLRVRAVFSSMEQPLGRCVGNALEVVESLEILRGAGPADTQELTVQLAARLFELGGRVSALSEGEALAREALADGSALEKFMEIVEAQGGDVEALRAGTALSPAPAFASVRAPREGFVSALDAFYAGRALVGLGGGRRRAEDRIDARVGFEFFKKMGESVACGDELARVYARDNASARAAAEELLASYAFSDEPVEPPALILGELGA